MRFKKGGDRMKVEEMEKLLDPQRLPRHIAIIMDGNGRWARKRHLPRVEGHKAALRAVREVVETCGKLGVEVLTLYTFSTENWKRPKSEVGTLMALLKEQLRREAQELNKNNVQLRAIGEIDELPPDVAEELRRAIELTKDNTGLKLVLAVNYGGRREIARAARRLAEAALKGQIDPSRIDEDLFSKYLYDPDLPDPDLLIRTSGEMRVSNFLLWQIAYTELYITPVLWPDFRKEHLLEAILEYQRRERRFGGI